LLEMINYVLSGMLTDLRHLILSIVLIQGSHTSWIFFRKISRTWKVIENEFNPGKSWNLPVVLLNQHVFYV